jgi:hypothetical protein
VSGQETHTSAEKYEARVEELLNMLWRSLKEGALRLVEVSGPLNNNIKEVLVGNLEQVPLVEVENFEKERQGMCKKCGESFLKDLQYRYEAGVFIDKSSGELIAIYASYQEIRYAGKIIDDKRTYVAGFKATKVKKLITIEDFDKKEEIMKEAELPPVLPKDVDIFRHTVQCAINLLEKEKESRDWLKEELLRRCKTFLPIIEKWIAEKAQELEKIINRIKIEMTYSNYSEGTLLWDDKHTAKRGIEDGIQRVLRSLLTKGIEKWLSPLKCKNIVQLNEHTERKMICLGSLFDLHLHVEYEEVKKDESFTARIVMEPIRVAETSKQLEIGHEDFCDRFLFFVL